MIRSLIRAAALAAALGLGACEDQLSITNPNDPDTERVLSSPSDAEALAAAYYKRWHDGLYRTQTNFHGMANVMSFQNYSSLFNNCQNTRYPFTTANNNNLPGNPCSGEQSRVYFVHNEVARVMSNFVRTLDGGLTLGSPARDLRARSFAEFLRGASLGYVALFYDSSATPSPSMSAEEAGDLRPHTEVFDSALAALQRSIDHANTPALGGDGFPLPASWIPGPTTYSAAEFVRLVRTYRARLRANVARTPAERRDVSEGGVVDWSAVIDDSQNGITADHLNTTSTVSGPFYTWLDTYDPPASTWHQMSPFIIGMGDVSGSYAEWIAKPLADRGAGNVSFTMVSPDLRFPQGATRPAQQADFNIANCANPGGPCKRYFQNRAEGADNFAGAGWGWSNYDFARFHWWAAVGDAGTANNGPLPFFTKTELDMLEAEGHIREGNYAAAATLINKTRVPNGLPAITALDGTSPVPGGTQCVPKMPVNAGSGGGGTLACGTMMEAMKWEKRIETAFTHFAGWYLDHRGWGDLAEGVALFWAVPFEDLLARGYDRGLIYSAGQGAGNAPNSVAGPSTYGW
jgi:hypothetical protein